MRTEYYDTVAKPPFALFPRATSQWGCRYCLAAGYRWDDSPEGVVYTRSITCAPGESHHDWFPES